MTKDDKEMEDWFGRPTPKTPAPKPQEEARVYTRVGGKVARVSGPEPKNKSKGHNYSSGSRTASGFYSANDGRFDDGTNAGKYINDDFSVFDTAKSPPLPPKPKCYESHPPYEIAPGLIIYGSSGILPMVEGCDVYVSFDTARIPGWRSYPWQPDFQDFIYKITDRQAPSNIGSFKKLLEFLAERLHAGKKVHIGCIGGHGRTGLVLAALRTHLTGDTASAAHVRANYCSKAIETQEQIDFLKEHFGIDPVEARYYSGKGLPNTFKKEDFLPVTAPAATPAPEAKVRVIRFDDDKTPE